MKSPRLTNAAIAVALLALATLVLWQHLRARRLLAETVNLRDQLEQTATLQQENERLTRQLRTASERSQAELAELARLRGLVVRMRQMEQENTQLKIEHDRLAKRVSSSAPDTQEPDAQQAPEQKWQRAKGAFGRDIGLALIRAAEANGGNLPNELSGPIFEMVETLSAGAEYGLRAKSFELVYSGSLHDVKDDHEIILAREKEPVQRADGRWVRLYVMADSSSRYISAESRDGFAAREKEFWPGQTKP